jgi:hypothetical protein
LDDDLEKEEFNSEDYNGAGILSVSCSISTIAVSGWYSSCLSIVIECPKKKAESG